MCFISGLSQITAASAICESAPSIFHSNKEPCISCKYYVWLFRYVRLLALLPQRHSYFFSHNRCADASFVIFSETHFGIYYFFPPPPSANQWAALGKRWRTTWGTRGTRSSDSSPTLSISLLSERSTLTAWVTPAPSPSPSGRRVSDAKTSRKTIWLLRYFAVWKVWKKNLQSY